MAERSYLILDIETVPDDELFTPPEAGPGVERPFPPLHACRPVVLGVMWLDETLACKRMGTIGEAEDEAGMLTDFSDFMTRFQPQLVTWNGRGFDLPVLRLRALRYGLSFPWYYEKPETRDRRSEEGHLDLADYLADHGAARMTSLDGVSRLCGLPGKAGLDGSQVEGLFRSGQMETLRSYCLSDVAQTAFVFLRTLLLVGKIDRAWYQRVAAALLAVVETDGRSTRMVSGIDRTRLLLRE